MPKTFEDDFRVAIDSLQCDARAAGVSMTAICQTARVSRACTSRWKKTPSTVETLTRLQLALEKCKSETVMVYLDDVVVRKARPLHAGLVKGGSVLIGWTKVLVTQSMVGRFLAVFTAIEVKAEKGYVTPEQENFIDQVSKAGGRAAVARSEADALALIATLQDLSR